MGKEWHGGKGSDPRPVSREKYNQNWDKIFKKKSVQPKKNDL